jgi:hypothetical protein
VGFSFISLQYLRAEIMGLKWSEISEDLKASIESVLSKNLGPMSTLDVFLLLKACSFMGYKLHDKKEVAESIFSMFRIAFSKEDSFERNSHSRFVSCINLMAKIGLEWAVAPEEMKLAVFQGIENRSPFRFTGVELSRLFQG